MKKEVTEERAYVAARAAQLLEIYKKRPELAVHTYMQEILIKIGFGDCIPRILNETSDESSK